MTARYRIVNHKRFIAFVAITMIISVCLINIVLGLATAQSMAETTYVDYEVCAGDTLWNIAQDNMSQYEDVREAVYQLCKINDINASELQAGMTIIIPVTNM